MSGKEIINIQVGCCGNCIGNKFWDRILSEHLLEKDGMLQEYNEINSCQIEMRLSKIHTYFYEKHRGILTNGYIRQNIEEKYKKIFIPNDVKKLCKYYLGSFNAVKFAPRSIAIDLDTESMDNILSSNIGNLFNPNNFINGTCSTNNNWAKGYLSMGHELIDEIMDVIRCEIENCDYFQGFQLCHSIGGGTGSGLGLLILEKLKDCYPNKLNCNFTVYPSPKVSDVVIEAYNTMLSINKLIQHSDINFVIDNEKLYKISHYILKQKETNYDDFNWITSMVMSGVTSPLRYCTKLYGDLRRFSLNTVPFPRLHFLLMSQSPIYRQGTKINLTMQELTWQMWSHSNFFADFYHEDFKYLMAFGIYRGMMAMHGFEDEMIVTQQRMAEDFIEWIPNHIKCGSNIIGPSDTLMSGTLIANNTGIKGTFQRLSAQFARLYKNRQFLHLYKCEAMEESDFQEAEKNVINLIEEYQDKQDVVVNLWSDDEEDDDEDDSF